jgi:hypothetical protein
MFEVEDLKMGERFIRHKDELWTTGMTYGDAFELLADLLAAYAELGSRKYDMGPWVVKFIRELFEAMFERFGIETFPDVVREAWAVFENIQKEAGDEVKH